MICCSNDGEIRGYKFSTEDTNVTAANTYKNCQEALRDLYQRKQVKKNKMNYLKVITILKR